MSSSSSVLLLVKRARGLDRRSAAADVDVDDGLLPLGVKAATVPRVHARRRRAATAQCRLLLLFIVGLRLAWPEAPLITLAVGER